MEKFLCVYTHHNYTCLQGMFHPARKVRDVYWKIYNSLYIGSQVRANSVVIILWFKLFLPVRSCLCEDVFKKAVEKAVSEFTSASISRRVYERILCYEYQLSFILKLGLMTVIKICT